MAKTGDAQAPPGWDDAILFTFCTPGPSTRRLQIPAHAQGAKGAAPKNTAAPLISAKKKPTSFDECLSLVLPSLLGLILQVKMRVAKLGQ